MLTNEQTTLVNLSLLLQNLESQEERAALLLSSPIFQKEEDIFQLESIKHAITNIATEVYSLADRYFDLYEIDHFDYLELEKEYLAEHRYKRILMDLDENGYFPAI